MSMRIRRTGKKTALSSRYAAENLEPRRLLSTVTWTGAGDGVYWNDVHNWDSSTGPQNGDDVVINAGPGTTTVASSMNLSLNSVTSTSPVRINFGKLSVAAASSFSGGLEVLGSEFDSIAASTFSTLTSDDTSSKLAGLGSLTINGAFNWRGGTLAIANTTLNGGLTLGPAGETLAGVKLTIPASQTATMGGGTLTLQNKAIFENDGALNSSGGVIASDGSTTVFNNVGTLNAVAGTTTLSTPDSGTTTGTFSVAAGASLNFSSNYALANPQGPSGAGTVGFTHGTTTITGTYDVTGGTQFTGGNVNFNGTIISLGDQSLSMGFGTVNFGSNNLQFATVNLNGGAIGGTGSLTITGLFTWAGGPLSFSNTYANGGVTFSQNDALSQGSLFIPAGQTGTVIGYLVLENGATFNNAGTFIGHGGALEATGTSSTINNTGTFISGDTTNASFENPGGGYTFNNSGVFDINYGTPIFDVGQYNSTNGSMNIGAAASVQMLGTFDFNAGSSLTVAGTLAIAVCNFAAGSSVSGAGTLQLNDATVAGAYDITGNTQVSYGQLLLQVSPQNLGNFSLSNGASISCAGNIVINSPLSLSGGYLEGSGSLTTTAPLTLTNMTIETTLLPEAGITFLGQSDSIYNSTTIPAGQTWIVDCTQSLEIPPAFVNNGTLNAISGGISSNYSPAQTFTNNGAITVNDPGGTFAIGGCMTFLNPGAVNLTAGTFVLSAGDKGSTTGAYSVAAAATIDFAIPSNQSISLSSGSSIAGAGNVEFSGGASTVGGTYNVGGTTTILSSFNTRVTLNSTAASTGALNISGGNVGGTGNLTVSGAFIWTGGDLAIGSTRVEGGMQITPTNLLGLTAGALTNAAGSAATIANSSLQASGGTFENDGTLTFTKSGIAGGAFSNSGTITVNAAGATTTITPDSLNDSGVVNVVAGTLVVGGGGYGGLLDDGIYNVSAAGTLDVQYAVYSAFGSPSSIIGAGTVILETPGQLYFYGSYNITGQTTFGASVDLIFKGHLLDLGSSPSIPFGCSVDFQSNDVTLPSLTLAGDLTGAGTLTINGPFTWASGTLSMANTIANDGTQLRGPSILSGGTFTNPAGQTVTFSGTLSITNSATFINNGVMSFLNGSIGGSSAILRNNGTFNFSASTFSIGFLTFRNQGAFNVLSGNLSLFAGDPTAESGTFSIASGAALNLTSYTFWPGETVTGAGTLNCNGGAGLVTVNGTFTQTGPISVSSNGTLIFNSAVATLGPVMVGIGSTLNLGNNATHVSSLNLLGTLSGSGALTLDGMSTWPEGTLSVPKIFANGGLDLESNHLSSSSVTLSGGQLINPFGQTASIGVTSNTTLVLQNGAQLVNNGTLIAGLGGLTAFGGAAGFSNSGATDLESGTANFSIGSGVTLMDTGLITVQAGILTLSGSDGGLTTGTFSVSSGASLVFGGSFNLASTASIGGGGYVSVTGGTLSLAAAQTFSGANLTIDLGAEVAITSAVASNTVGSLTFPSAGPGIPQIGVLDLGKSTLIVNYGASSDPIGAIQGYLRSGSDSGKWDGTGILSSAAAANVNHTTAIGYADWADGTGVNATPNTIELKYTLIGDANLDGQVNSADLQIMLFNLNRPGAWDQGDFNYDGQVNSADLQGILFTLNTNLGNQATPVAQAAVSGSATAGTAATSSTAKTVNNRLPVEPVQTPTALHVTASRKRIAKKHR